VKTVERVERGWSGHFIDSRKCLFRRNTLLTCGENRIVVSTVGNYFRGPHSERLPIGYGRYYETMVFEAVFDGRYWDADVEREVSFESQSCLDEYGTDADANAMHEKIVEEISKSLET
jgi:hypothetical protein